MLATSCGQLNPVLRSGLQGDQSGCGAVQRHTPGRTECMAGARDMERLSHSYWVIVSPDIARWQASGNVHFRGTEQDWQWPSRVCGNLVGIA